MLERWRAVFLPFLGQDGERMAVCQMENITKEYKRDKAIQMLEEENKCLSETTVSAIAMIRMGQGKPFYEKYNQAYERFQKLYQTCCSADSYIQWIKKLESLSKPATFQFSLPIDKKKPLCYTATLVPVIVEEKLEKIFVTITDAKTHVVLTGQTMDCLTKREKEVLEMAAQGCSNKHIALELAVTEGTIKKQLSSGYDKLGISSRTELVKFYLDYVERETK